MKFSVNHPCPCGSGNKYKKCCQVFHKGKIPANALELMKSRYSAYVVGDAKYIIKTTHINNPDFTPLKEQWEKDILEFCNGTNFKKLDIINFIDEKEESYVEFKVTMDIDDKDSSFIEKSRFLKDNNIWKYVDGEFK